ncbi:MULTISPECIES: hypothetical protein [Clavibacter]|uniref:Secreted protein n=2 Tax=Clavibacter TaxID=1573 RepID=A0A399NIG1_9MICO|nr:MULTISPECIES: hypothetical protein [Clavibacter]KDP91419.1 hypothetical protein W824_08060 [Clavibacter cf. michiganensis LMG 26808]RII93487.1 hypothetical protein DZF96_15525 [Clavibacter michiganensis]UKF25572.1 hypothetical protein KYT88_02400 [Clavibacter sp. A6099]
MSLASPTVPAHSRRSVRLLAAAATVTAVALFGMGAGDAAQAAPAHLDQSVVASSLLNGTFEHDVKSGKITADQLATVATEGTVVAGQHIPAWAAKGESHAQAAAEIRAEIQNTAPSHANAVENAAIQQTLDSKDGRAVTKADVVAQGSAGSITESKWFWSNHEWHIPGYIIKTAITVGVAVYIGTMCITLDLSKLSCLALGVVVGGLGEFIKSWTCGQGYYFDFPKVWKSHCGA